MGLHERVIPGCPIVYRSGEVDGLHANQHATVAAGKAIEQRAAAADLLRRAEDNERLAKEEAAKAALLRRVEYDIALAEDTISLLGAVSSLVSASGGCGHYDLAEFRRQLQPLALTYGYKIVLVGDKTKAMLVAV